MEPSTYTAIKENFSHPETVKQYSQLLNESTQKTEDFLQFAIPAILSEISGKTASMPELKNSQNVVRDLFGTDLNTVIVGLVQSSGFTPAKISQGLALTTPSVLNYLNGPAEIASATPAEKSEFDLSGVLFMIAIVTLAAGMIMMWVERARFIPMVDQVL